MDIQYLANQLLQAEVTKQPIAPLTETNPNITPADAYAIQLAQIEQKKASGAKVKGLKIGLTSKAMQEMLGVYTPDYGFVLDTMVFDEAQGLDSAQFIQPKVELKLHLYLIKHYRDPM